MTIIKINLLIIMIYSTFSIIAFKKHLVLIIIFDEEKCLNQYFKFGQDTYLVYKY